MQYLYAPQEMSTFKLTLLAQNQELISIISYAKIEEEAREFFSFKVLDILSKQLFFGIILIGSSSILSFQLNATDCIGLMKEKIQGNFLKEIQYFDIFPKSQIDIKKERPEQRPNLENFQDKKNKIIDVFQSHSVTIQHQRLQVVNDQ